MVTEAEIAQYEEQGHVTIRNLLPRTDVERLVERLDGMLGGRYPSDGFVCGPASWETPDDPGRFTLQVMAQRFPINDPVLAALHDSRGLREAAAALMRSERATVFQQQALIKGTDAPNATPWHQDDHYWQLQRVGTCRPYRGDGMDAAAPHHRPRRHHVAAARQPPPPHPRARLDPRREPVQDHHRRHPGAGPDLIPLELEPGDVSFHHKNMVHGAFANRGVERRVAIAQHYHNAPDKAAAFAHRRADPVPWRYQFKEARPHRARLGRRINRRGRDARATALWRFDAARGGAVL